jgi:hypothetical protein
MADYTNYIANTDFSGNTIQNNMSKINEYDNALKGKPSAVLNVSNPSLGKIFFKTTGEPCKKDTDRFKKYIADMTALTVSPTTSVTLKDSSLPFTTYSNYFSSGDGNPTRFNFIDAYKIRGISGEDGIFNSAASDLSSETDPNVEASKVEQNSCVPVTLQVMDADGSRKYETQFVTVADVDKISPDLYMTDADGNPLKPVIDSIQPVVEGFDANQIFDKMDAGQKVFVGSLGVLGLYVFFKLLYKPLSR